MALPAVSPRAAARAQPAFALTRAQGSLGREGGRGRGVLGPQKAGGDLEEASAYAPLCPRILCIPEGPLRSLVHWGPGLLPHGAAGLHPWVRQEMEAMAPQCWCQGGRSAPCGGAGCESAFTSDLSARSRPPGQAAVASPRWSPDSLPTTGRCRSSRKGRL